MNGPVELMVLEFPRPAADPGVVAAIAEVVANGDITLLDLLFLARADDGRFAVVDVEEGVDAFGLGTLTVSQSHTLVSTNDVTTVQEGLAPGTSAAIIVYEHTWASRVVDAVRAAGGELALHLRVPAEDVEAALAAEAAAIEQSV